MGFEVQLAAGDLASVRRALKQVGDQGLGKQMAKQLRAATRPLAKEIRAEVPKAMPSGYAPVLSKSLRFRQSIKEARQTATVVYRVYADGQTERRDLPTLNRGRLRHPVYGRRRQPWVNQRVRPGVVDRPVDRLAPQVGREMAAVLDYVVDQLKG
ncbi:hypothetical protein ABGB07_03905 [Micromonosporaceae bacterium B7E4]